MHPPCVRLHQVTMCIMVEYIRSKYFKDKIFFSPKTAKLSNFEIFRHEAQSHVSL